MAGGGGGQITFADLVNQQNNLESSLENSIGTAVNASISADKQAAASAQQMSDKLVAQLNSQYQQTAATLAPFLQMGQQSGQQLQSFLNNGLQNFVNNTLMPATYQMNNNVNQLTNSANSLLAPMNQIGSIYGLSPVMPTMGQNTQQQQYYPQQQAQAPQGQQYTSAPQQQSAPTPATTPQGTYATTPASSSNSNIASAYNTLVGQNPQMAYPPSTPSSSTGGQTGTGYGYNPPYAPNQLLTAGLPVPGQLTDAAKAAKAAYAKNAGTYSYDQSKVDATKDPLLASMGVSPSITTTQSGQTSTSKASAYDTTSFEQNLLTKAKAGDTTAAQQLWNTYLSNNKQQGGAGTTGITPLQQAITSFQEAGIKIPDTQIQSYIDKYGTANGSGNNAQQAKNQDAYSYLATQRTLNGIVKDMNGMDPNSPQYQQMAQSKAQYLQQFQDIQTKYPSVVDDAKALVKSSGITDPTQVNNILTGQATDAQFQTFNQNYNNYQGSLDTPLQKNYQANQQATTAYQQSFQPYQSQISQIKAIAAKSAQDVQYLKNAQASGQYFNNNGDAQPQINKLVQQAQQQIAALSAQGGDTLKGFSVDSNGGLISPNMNTPDNLAPTDLASYEQQQAQQSGGSVYAAGSQNPYTDYQSQYNQANQAQQQAWQSQYDSGYAAAGVTPPTGGTTSTPAAGQASGATGSTPTSTNGAPAQDGTTQGFGQAGATGAYPGQTAYSSGAGQAQQLPGGFSQQPGTNNVAIPGYTVNTGNSGMDQFMQSPFVQSQIQLGTQAILGNQAASGMLNSGATLEQLQKLGAQVGSSSLGVYNQGLQTYNQAAGNYQAGVNAVNQGQGIYQNSLQQVQQGLGSYQSGLSSLLGAGQSAAQTQANYSQGLGNTEAQIGQNNIDTQSNSLLQQGQLASQQALQVGQLQYQNSQYLNNLQNQYTNGDQSGAAAVLGGSIAGSAGIGLLGTALGFL